LDITLILAASLVYLLASVIYGAYLLRFAAKYARLAVAFLALGVVLNLAAVVIRGLENKLAFDAYNALLASAALVVIGFLVSLLRKPSHIVGAFIAPVATMILYSLHVFHKEASLGQRNVIDIVTPVHITASLVGFLVLTVSAVASALLIVQEFRLKKKTLHVGQAGGLPSLQTLEKVCHRSLVFGFPIYTVGVVLGMVWFLRDTDPGMTRHLIMAGFSWLLYGATLYARIVRGWQGRRAALLTLLAFASVLFVIFLSILRTGG